MQAFRYKSAIALALLMGAGAVPGVASEQTGEGEGFLSRLDTMVITGTRDPRKLGDSPVRTDLVSAEELERTHARDLGEALENVPGLQLREIHGKSGQEVWLQGIDANRVLILVDGLPMTATTGSSVDVSQLALLDIERIEVVKGAVSAQYGSAAMGGVVNVITQDIPSGVGGRVTADAGTYGDQNPGDGRTEAARRHGQASLSLGGERLRYRVAGSRRENDGIQPDSAQWQRPGDETERSQLNQRLEWHPSDQVSAYGELDYFLEDIESRYTLQRPGASVDHTGFERAERWRGLAGFEVDAGGGAGYRMDLLHERLDNDTEKQRRGESERFDQREATLGLSQLSGSLRQPVGQSQLWQFGADYRHETLEQTVDGASELAGDDESRSSHELWGQNTWMWSDRWEWVIGLRGQYDSDFGEHLAPKVNTRYDLVQGRELDLFLRAGWGQGYRVPNLKERHYRFDHSQIGYVVEGSPDLRPETSDSYQLGVGAHLGRFAWWDLNGFHNRIDDLIQTEFDADATSERGDGVDVYRYDNVGAARTRGVETVLGIRPAPDWSLSLSYTYTEAEDRDTGDRLTRRPRHQATLGLDAPLSHFGTTGAIRLRHQSHEVVDAEEARTSPGFTTVDMRLNQSVRRHLTLFAGLDNLTDVQRDFGDGNDFRPVAGRFLYAGLRMDFGHQASSTGNHPSNTGMTAP